MSRVGKIVIFKPHDEHPQFEGFAELAALVGGVNADGTLDLAVFVPNKELVWMDDVPPGDGHYSWREMTDVFEMPPPTHVPAAPQSGGAASGDTGEVPAGVQAALTLMAGDPPPAAPTVPAPTDGVSSPLAVAPAQGPQAAPVSTTGAA